MVKYLKSFFQALILHCKIWLFEGPLFVRNPRIWFDYHYNVGLLVWVLERRRLNDPETTGALPHVNTSSRGAKGMEGGMEYEEPIVKELVLIGAGHAHVFVLKNFTMNPEKNLRITVIADGVDTPYSGMLPGFVSGAYERDECHIDVVKITEFAKARLILGKAVKVEENYVQIDNGPNVYFDICSINVGSSPTLPSIGSHLVNPVKPISKFSFNLNRISDRNNEGEKLRIAVVGGGAGGVEILLSLQKRLNNASELVLISRSSRLCPSHSMRVGDLMEKVVKSKNNITMKLNCEVIRVEECIEDNPNRKQKIVFMSNNEKELFDEIIWCTSACGQELLKNSVNFQVDEKGFVLVNNYLQVIGRENVFAVGDCNSIVSNPCAKAGVFAVRQGPPLSSNIRCLLRGERKGLVSYLPQRSFLGIIGTANERAIASRGELAIESDWLWNLKDWIDRKWMSQYSSALPKRLFKINVQDTNNLSNIVKSVGDTVISELSSSKVRCGGCGSKIGATLLSRSLAGLRIESRREVLSGIEKPDDCALLQFTQPDGDYVLQTVDFFRSIWKDEYIFGQIAANHALSDIHAMGGDAVSALCMVQVPFSPENILEKRLSRLMQGAVEFLNKSNCTLVGGHTSEGAELVMGFCVSGTLKTPPLTKGGMKPGDVLILTKQLGTGYMMEANMQLRAKGEWVEKALQSMLKSNASAGNCLIKYQASACTDVTGFGLVGHLWEMIKASPDRVAIELDINRVPMLQGISELMQDPVSSMASTLQNQNARASKIIENYTSLVKQSPVLEILFDPQTAGGLLASISEEKALDCLNALKTLGYEHGAIIGRVVSRQIDSNLIKILNV